MTGMDDTFRKLIRPMDARGSKGIMSRGRNVYKGGSPSPTPVGVDPKLSTNRTTNLKKIARSRLGLK